MEVRKEWDFLYRYGTGAAVLATTAHGLVAAERRVILRAVRDHFTVVEPNAYRFTWRDPATLSTVARIQRDRAMGGSGGSATPPNGRGPALVDSLLLAISTPEHPARALSQEEARMVLVREAANILIRETRQLQREAHPASLKPSELARFFRSLQLPRAVATEPCPAEPEGTWSEAKPHDTSTRDEKPAGPDLRAGARDGDGISGTGIKAHAALTAVPPGSEQPHETGEYQPASWFPKEMAARLRMAARKDRKTKRVATKQIDGVVFYSVADARRWWPKDTPKEA